MPERIKSLFVILVLLLLARPAAADPGQPVAVRWWGQGFVTIETFWNLRVAIDPDRAHRHRSPRQEVDLLLISDHTFDKENAPLYAAVSQTVISGLSDGEYADIDVVLDRRPNDRSPDVFPATDERPRSGHAIRVHSFRAHEGPVPGRSGPITPMLIEVDGVRIFHASRLGQSNLVDAMVEQLERVDVLLVPVGGALSGSLNAERAAALTARLAPRLVVPIWPVEERHEDRGGDSVKQFLEALPSSYDRREAVGNTLAVRSLGPGERVRPAVVVLKTQPWSMPEAMADLFRAKDAAGRASQEVFRPLSAAQMNHRPADGTHTPRWNVEHMAGRELGFFSQIYHAAEGAVPVMDVNPKQMPPDYVAAHPDWDGAEEARQIERVQAFTRRFAYLLDGADLDEKPEGHRWWTLRGLLAQMQRHYGEHTANVKKKFALPDWPDE
jgi:hypothetical protein